MTYRRKRKKERECVGEKDIGRFNCYRIMYATAVIATYRMKQTKLEAEIELKNYESIDNDTTGTNCAVIDGVVSLEDYIIINFPEAIVNAKLEIIGSGQENVRDA
jgi:hypothetical protein